MTTIEISGVVENLHTHREVPWAEKGEHKYVVDVAQVQTTTTDTSPEGFVKSDAKVSHKGYRRGKRTTQEKTRPFYKFPRDSKGRPYVNKEGFEWCLWQKFMEITCQSKWDGPKGRATVFDVTKLESGNIVDEPTTLTVGLKRDMGMQYQVFERMDYVKFTAKVHTPLDEAKANSYLEAMNDWKRFGPTNRGFLTIEVM